MNGNRYMSSRDVVGNINELQTYLRYIAKNIDGIPVIVPDGIYGPKTREAVSAFQRRMGLPVTGEADFETWTAIVEVYDELFQKNEMPRKISAYPLEIPHLKEGDKFEEIYMLQIMLRRMAKIFKNIEMPDLTGVYDLKTKRAVQDFARLYGKHDGEVVDRQLWNVLTDTYNAFTHNG